MPPEEDLPDPPTFKQYSVPIGDALHEKLERHVTILKHATPRKMRKQDWLLEAFQEMMQEEESKPNTTPPKNRVISFQLNEYFVEKLNKIVNQQKKFRSSYSKKKWFIEAIHRKLERDEERVNKYFEELKNRTF